MRLMETSLHILIQVNRLIHILFLLLFVSLCLNILFTFYCACVIHFLTLYNAHFPKDSKVITLFALQLDPLIRTIYDPSYSHSLLTILFTLQF